MMYGRIMRGGGGAGNLTAEVMAIRGKTGWVTAGALLALVGSSAFAASTTPALQGAILQKSDGSLYLFHDGTKWPVSPQAMDDGQIDAIADASSVSQVGQPFSLKIANNSSGAYSSSVPYLLHTDVQLVSVERLSQTQVLAHFAVTNHNPDRIGFGFDGTYLLGPDGTKSLGKVIDQSAINSKYDVEERRIVDILFDNGTPGAPARMFVSGGGFGHDGANAQYGALVTSDAVQFTLS
jgi:hypothetical protein